MGVFELHAVALGFQPRFKFDFWKSLGKGIGQAAHDVGNAVSGPANGIWSGLTHTGQGVWDMATLNEGGAMSEWGQAAKSYGQGFGLIPNDQPLQPQTPGAAPTLQGANWTALQGELQQEKNMRATWGSFTGGGGMLENPSTQNTQLLGG